MSWYFHPLTEMEVSKHLVRFPNPLATATDIHGSWGTWLPNTNLCLPPFQHFSVAAKYFIYFFFSPQKDLPGQPLLKSTKNFLNFQYLKYQSILSKGTYVFPRYFQKLQKQLQALMSCLWEDCCNIYSDMRAALLFVRPRLRLTGS